MSNTTTAPATTAPELTDAQVIEIVARHGNHTMLQRLGDLVAVAIHDAAYPSEAKELHTVEIYRTDKHTGRAGTGYIGRLVCTIQRGDAVNGEIIRIALGALLHLNAA